MTTRPQLPAPELVTAEHVEEVNEAQELRDRLDDLESELRELRQKVDFAWRIIKTVHTAFTMGSTPVMVTDAVPSANDRWEKMKQKLGGKKAEVIQALQDHGAMTRSQLRAVTASGMSTIDAITASLRDMGIIIKQGDSWILKG